MAHLSFFPWSIFDSVYTFKNFTVVPVDLNQQSPQNLTLYWSDIKTILGHYENNSNCRISSSSIVLLNSTPINNDLKEDDIIEIFVYREILTISALTKRAFFQSWNYFSSDSLKLVIQRFQPPATSPSLVTRRRDGSTTCGFSSGVFKERCPPHVSANTKIQFDNDLALALLEVYENDEVLWNDIYDSIQNFNLANTDSSELRMQIELVLCVGALERLFNLTQGKEDLLATAIYTFESKFSFI